jgi:hypothetical protein
MVSLIVPRRIEKKNKKGERKFPPLLAMVGLLVPRSTRKKKRKKGGAKVPLLSAMVESKAPPSPLAMAGPIAPRSMKKKKRESKLPHYWPSSLDHLCPKTKKKKNGCMLTLE